MARRSILSPARDEKPAAPEPGPALPTTPIIQESAPEPAVRRASTVKPSRIAKLHLGGYYNVLSPRRLTVKFRNVLVSAGSSF